MFIQGFLYQWPALFQVSLSVFRKQSCKTALLQESSGIVLFGESWLLPTIRNSEEFRFIYRGGKVYTSDLTSFEVFLNTCTHTCTSFPILSCISFFPAFYIIQQSKNMPLSLSTYCIRIICSMCSRRIIDKVP